MRKTFALPTLLSTTTALAMIAVLPAACADDTTLGTRDACTATQADKPQAR